MLSYITHQHDYNGETKSGTHPGRYLLALALYTLAIPPPLNVVPGAQNFSPNLVDLTVRAPESPAERSSLVSQSNSSRLRSRLPPTTAVAEVDPQLPPVHNLRPKMLLRALCGRDVDEVSVSEATWLTAAAINGNSNVQDVTDFTEEV